jgi:malate dehydrogenase (oxaloacetate-decarboxylating)
MLEEAPIPPAPTPMSVHAGGKLRVESRLPLRTREMLALAYTPGVADVCLAIRDQPALARTHTIKGNSVAVVTDGTAVLGLGDIGPLAAEPVMAGKAMILREFAGINGFPICLDTRDVDEIVRTVSAIAPVFGAILLEDIAAPRCFEIERRLQAELAIPVLHDDQHGTAVVVVAGLANALRLTGRRWEEARVVINGAGAAGTATADLLLQVGVRDLVLFDSAGPLWERRPDLTGEKSRLAACTNPAGFRGSLREALAGADVLVSLSRAGAVGRADVSVMAERAIVFALANPVPEIRPEEVVDTPVEVMATGRSDYPNQVNNSLAFPGIFRGALDSGAAEITRGMLLAAAGAIAGSVPPALLAPGYIVPSPIDIRVPAAVAAAVAQASCSEAAAASRR